MLLADVYATSVVGATAGDSFQASIIPGANTCFLDQNGNAINYTSTPGDMTITSVPEPSTLALGGLGLLALVSRGVRQRR